MKIAFKGFIYESALLEAYTKDDIYRIYKDKINNWLNINDYATVSDKDIVAEIYDVDPSNDKKWLGVITQWLLSKRIEDLEAQIKPDLIRFKRLLDINPGKFGGVSKEMAKGKIDYNKFKEVLANNGIESKEEYTISEKVGDFPKVSENDKYVMYLVDEWVSGNSDKHFCFQGDVDWCVKYQTYFDDYKPPYYYILSKETGKEYALMHVGSMQLKNIRDNGLSLAEFKPIADLVLPIIEENNSTITGDFKVVLLYLKLGQTSIKDQYPNLYKQKTINNILIAIKANEWELVKDICKNNKDLDFTNYSRDLFNAMGIKEVNPPEDVLDVLFEYQGIDVNTLLSRRPALIQFITYNKTHIANKIINDPNFDFNYINYQDECLLSMFGNSEFDQIPFERIIPYATKIAENIDLDVLNKELDDYDMSMNYTVFHSILNHPEYLPVFNVLVNRGVKIDSRYDNAIFDLLNAVDRNATNFDANSSLMLKTVIENNLIPINDIDKSKIRTHIDYMFNESAIKEDISRNSEKYLSEILNLIGNTKQ